MFVEHCKIRENRAFVAAISHLARVEKCVFEKGSCEVRATLISMQTREALQRFALVPQALGFTRDHERLFVIRTRVLDASDVPVHAPETQVSQRFRRSIAKPLRFVDHACVLFDCLFKPTLLLEHSAGKLVMNDDTFVRRILREFEVRAVKTFGLAVCVTFCSLACSGKEVATRLLWLGSTLPMTPAGIVQLCGASTEKNSFLTSCCPAEQRNWA